LSIIMGKGGVLYGVAGGRAGTVFSLTPPTTPGGPWIEAVIYQFLGFPDVESPAPPLTISGNGTLYGSSSAGGVSGLCGNGCGTVFSLAPPITVGGAWTESILWSFDRNSLAGVPEAGVVIGDGVLYGTAQADSNRGFVFSLTPHPKSTGAWALSALYNFPDSASQYPVAVTVGPDGNLYGTTALVEKDKQGGTAFLLTPTAGGGSWTETTLWTFPTGNLNSVSEQPSGSISFARSGGSIFGVTSNKDDALGTVFQLVPPASGSGEWTEDVLDDRHTLTPALGIVSGGLVYGTDFAGNTVWSVGP
jgi:hypothetical protein